MISKENSIVESDRLYVRPLINSDHTTLFEIYSDKEAMKFRSNAALKNLEDAKRMIDNANEKMEKKNEFRLGIIENKTDELIGTFLYKMIDDKKCEVGYSIGKKHWRLGYGYEILNTMLNYLKEMGFIHVIATTKKENIASIKLLTKSGFKIITNENDKEINLFEKSLI